MQMGMIGLGRMGASVMAAYAEVLSILRNADVGKHARDNDAETAPLLNLEFYHYEMNLPEITEVWRRGSVISSWLLELTATALHDDPELQTYSGHVSDSAALYERFASRGKADFSNRILSAMRHEFGGHVENTGEALK